MGIAPDVLVDDRYRLEERVALGSTGQVWRATDLVLHRQVAIKVLHPERLDDEDFRHRFRAEARHAAQLSHPGVAEVHDYGEQGDLAFLVMEYLPGRPLAAVLDERRRDRREDDPGLALGVEATLEIVAQVAGALQAAHDIGLIHRDIKPANLIVGRDGNVKITDFGTARALDASTVTEPGVVVGTAQYLSPEQAEGHPASPATDVYALGIVAYACLAGDPPFGGASPVEIAAAHVSQAPPPLPEQVPDHLCRLVDECLAKDPEDRPASAGEVAQRCATGRADGPGSAALPRPPPYRRPVSLSAAAGAALAIGGMLVLGTDSGFTPSMPLMDGQRLGVEERPDQPRPQPGPVHGNPAEGAERPYRPRTPEAAASPGHRAGQGSPVGRPGADREGSGAQSPSPARSESPRTDVSPTTAEEATPTPGPTSERGAPPSQSPSAEASTPETPRPTGTPAAELSGVAEALDLRGESGLLD